MNDQLIAALKSIWNNIHNPKSSCPDVEIGHVLDVLSETLAECYLSDFPLSPIQRWILSYITIAGEHRATSLGWEYSLRRIKRYLDDEKDEYGYPKSRDWEDIERDEQELIKMVEAEAAALIEEGLLIERDNYLYLPGNNI